jgi:hypothetical protein
MEERKVDYWGAQEEERLIYDDKNEAIEAILEDLGIEDIADMPETIEVCGYARMRPNIVESYKGDILERLLESLDEEHADPEGDRTEPTEAMQEAEAAFLAVIQKEYEAWGCEEIIRETVNVKEWVKAHRPDWLET